MKLVRTGYQYYETTDKLYVIENYMGSWVIKDYENDEITDFASFREAKANLSEYIRKKAQA